MSSSAPAARPCLISTETLAARLDQEEPGPRLVDCRFDLLHTEAGRTAYRQGHLPGAVYAHLDEDLAGPVTPVSGRHPLPDPGRLAQRLADWRIGPDTEVVCYDARDGVFASRLWWLLRWLGHERVAVLDGGLAKWTAEQRPLHRQGDESATSTPGPALPAAPRPGMTIDSGGLGAVLDSDALCLIDVRETDRFAGEREPLDPVAGHIPGAVNLPFGKNLDASGCFLPAEALRKMYLRLLDGRAPADAVLMCGSGVSACHSLLAMELAGLPGARLYAGSWSEWIRDPGRPVAIGAGD
ncbi:sulfurtransferase [Thiohalobacter sp. IOR34]|uniref:sulfurtransferase n=1 Tax=Thiohalobacter sp. IOR34 TaxID=3057176 RepID=UPI0025AFFA06|nr:sulfurtransferase [Thiohalobacter sp. IOR34]WJW76118.1 sulfurtransferase [Thiohalobacter sp. IOR34]